MFILDISFDLHLRRRPAVFWMKFITPSCLFTFICFLSGLIPASAPLTRIAVVILMILLVLVCVPPYLPPSSLLAKMISHNLTLEILVLIQTILMVSLNLCCAKKSDRCARIIKIVDIVTMGILFLMFIIFTSINILSAPIIV